MGNKSIVKLLGLGLGLGTGPRPGIGAWDWGLVNGEWGMGKWEIESTPVPGDDSIMPGASHPPPPNF